MRTLPRAVAAAFLSLALLTACGDRPSSEPSLATSGVPDVVAEESAQATSPDESGVAALNAAGQASAKPSSAGPKTAPTQTFGVGVSQFTFSRAGRTLRTLVFYPSTGSAGGSPKSNAPVAAGRFPLVLWSHGLHGSPEGYQGVSAKIAAAGFVVAAPAYPFTNDKANPFNQGDMSNQPADASAVITEVLKLDTKAGAALAGHIETGRVGAAGHSAGGYTTAGMLSGSGRDSRLKGGIIVAGGGMGGKFSGAATPVLFIHGDKDGTVPYSSGKSLYDSCSWPKGFLTLLGGDHGAALFGSTPAALAVSKTMIDFFRYSLYGDGPAKSRLRGDATVSGAARYDGTL
ncbi:chlorophyllase [Dactylosporangium sp. AC04546]|uniref:alpha/beta hydrolase family protein n=1 Tax=Dactylosporangium sp. AC04546 TaxID=2862460 RepID=UPI001EE08731|nr:chlorophyllase [Dactylosporangium sp. AC04546]WVK84547.1 chlorophyllase [Dactylosporangium sp. AC04546]